MNAYEEMKKEQKNPRAIPVLVLLADNAIVFGYTEQPRNRSIILTRSRSCTVWGPEGGVLWGLAERGPDADFCNTSVQVEGEVVLHDVIAVLRVSGFAEEVWSKI